MTTQFSGEFSTLDPPLVIGGVAYGAVVRFNTNPQKPASPHSVCPGVFALEPEALTGELKKVVCRRAFQFDSFTHVEGFGNSWEEVFPVLMGGNVCQTTEPQRLYSWVNPRAFRGSDALDRAQPGDVLWWNGRAFLIVSCTAFGEAPGAVTWQGDTNLPTTYYRDVSPNAIALTPPSTAFPNEGARIHFLTGHDGVFGDCGLYAGPNTSTLALIARKVFNGVEEPDPYLYPADASFADDAAEYWVNPASFEFRIGSFTATLGDTLGALYYHRGLLESANGGVTFFVIEGTGYGYGISGGTEDSICLASTITRGDFSQAFQVHKGAANEYGAGSVEWRMGSAPDDPFAAITWANGTIDGVVMRPAKGEPIEAVAFTPNGSPFTGDVFHLRVVKAGGEVELAWSTDGASWTVAATVEIPDVATETEGNLGAATWGAQAIKVLGWIASETLRLLPFSPGTLSRTTFQFWEDVAYEETIPLPGATDVTSVEFERVLMDGTVELVSMDDNDGEPRRRDWYQIDGDEITFRSETSGDRVRIVQEAEEGSPATPGRPPRMGNTVGMADGGTDVSDNVANHMDVLGVHDPFGELTATAGEDFEVRRDPVFSSLDPPELQFDEKGNGEHDWEELPEEARLFRPVEGLALLTVSWLDGFDPGTNLCFRAVDEGFSQAGNMEARQVNDLGKAVDAFDELSVEIGVAGATTGISGTIDVRTPLPSGFTCVGCSLVDRTGLLIGRRDRAGWFEEVEGLIARGASYPYWRDHGGGLIGKRYVAFEDVMGYTSSECDVPHVCCPGNPVTASWNEKGIGTVGARVDVFPFNAISSPHFGAPLIAGPTGDPVLGGASFSFMGADFDPRGIFSRLPAGSTILQATLEATFSGLTSCAYTGRKWAIQPVPGSVNTYLNEFYLNGLLKEREHYVDGVLVESITNSDEDVPYNVNEAPIGFVLVGRRLDSKNVFLPLAGAAGEYRLVPDADWQSFGGALSPGGTAVAGKQRLVDVTQDLQALLAARSSLFRDFQFWPSRAGVEPGSSTDALRAFAERCTPDVAVTDEITIDGGTRIHEVDFTFAGQYTSWSGVSFGKLIVRFRCPGSVVERVVLPINWPRMVE